MKEVSFMNTYLDIGYINNQGLIHINKTIFTVIYLFIILYAIQDVSFSTSIKTFTLNWNLYSKVK